MKKANRKRFLSLALSLLLCLSLLPGAALAAEVQLSDQNLTVNGREIACQKYNIDWSNYFKLRDLAYLLNGTQAQFEVGYNDATKVISMTTGVPYTPNGSELETGADESWSCQESAQTVEIDGVSVSLTAYNIGGYNYFKLRDLGEALGFEVYFDEATNTAAVASPSLGLLSLKYSGGGHTDDPFGEWYVEALAEATPAVGDVDGDGKQEIIFAVRDIICMDAETSAIKWMTPYGHDTTEAGLTDQNAAGIGSMYVPTQIVDLDGDGQMEIVTVGVNAGTDKGWLGVYDGAGRFKFPVIETPYSIRGAKIADLDNDGKMEIIIGLGVGENNRDGTLPSIYVYEPDGSLRGGWPQPFGYGMYGNGIETVDLDGDGVLEVVLIGDQCWMDAFHADGARVTISGGPYDGLTWKDVIDFEDYDFTQRFARREIYQYTDERGGRYAMMGSRSGIVAVDVDGDGAKELVCTIMVNDQKMNDDIMGDRAMTVEDMLEGGIAKYFSIFILNLDHSRYASAAKGYDWAAWPQDVGEILTYDNFSVISNPNLSPVVADLDGDGSMELLYSSYDGMLHCFSLDGTENGAWPCDVNAGSGTLTMASRPAVADINGDGLAEVIFTTYTAHNAVTERGSLYVLDSLGNVLAKEELPQGWGKGSGDSDYGYSNGGQAQPVVADVDGDGAPEIVLATRNCGVCVYEIN